MVGNAAYQAIAADLLDNPVLSLANISHNPDAVSISSDPFHLHLTFLILLANKSLDYSCFNSTLAASSTTDASDFISHSFS